MVLQRAWEWGLPVVVGQCDVFKAFDNIDRGVAEEALRFLGLPVNLVAGFIREFAHQEVTVMLGGTTAGPIGFDRGGKQGGTDTPHIFKAIAHLAVSQLLVDWTAKGWGFPLEEGSYVQLMIWAGNLYIFATSRCMLSQMMQELTVAINKVKLAWKPGSLMYLENDFCDKSVGYVDLQFSTAGLGVEAMREVAHFETLGSKVDARATVRCALEHRLLLALKHWFARRSELCNSKCHLEWRLRRFYGTVVRTLMWGSEG